MEIRFEGVASDALSFFSALDSGDKQKAEEILADMSLGVFSKIEKDEISKDTASMIFTHIDVTLTEFYRTTVLSDEADEIINEGSWFGFEKRFNGSVKEPEKEYFESLASVIRSRSNP